MSTFTDLSNGSDSTVLSVILPAEIAEALDQAAGENLVSRAGHARRLLAAALRQSGHLAPIPAPRRLRATRHEETV